MSTAGKLFLFLIGLGVGCGEALPADPAPTGGGKADVWGDDDRIERWQLTSAAIEEAARSSAATIGVGELQHDAARGVWSAPSPTTVGDDNHLCPGQRFELQPAVASCSATLVADDIMVSAGHCFHGVRCEDTLVVFDYAYARVPEDLMDVTRDIPEANVYRCAEMLATDYSVDLQTERGADYSVFRLDRKVTGRHPAPVNWKGAVTIGRPAFVIGHPSGIPQKIASGKILDTSPEYVVHDADVFGGNSGGGLFDEDGRLIGIHVRSSAMRYVTDSERKCQVVAVCGKNAECPRKPHAYDLRALAAALSPELRLELGAD